jgi:tRNA threonylcarbamoyladenosine biosynthesis protein TsaB
MMVLAIDTCGPSGSIAIGRIEGETVSVLAQTELAGKLYSAQVIPAIHALLDQLGTSIRSIQAIVVVNGPGSFTGIRVGVSSAKGLAEALDIPIVAVSRLTLLAWKGYVERSALDAGRGEFYFRDGTQESLIGTSGLPVIEAVAVCEESTERAFSRVVPVEPPTAVDA